MQQLTRSNVTGLERRRGRGEEGGGKLTDLHLNQLPPLRAMLPWLNLISEREGWGGGPQSAVAMAREASITKFNIREGGVGRGAAHVWPSGLHHPNWRNSHEEISVILIHSILYIN